MPGRMALPSGSDAEQSRIDGPVRSSRMLARDFAGAFARSSVARYADDGERDQDRRGEEREARERVQRRERGPSGRADR